MMLRVPFRHPVRAAALVALGVRPFRRRRLLPRRLGKGLCDRRRAQGHHARVLEEHPRGSHQGRTRAGWPRNQGEHHVEGPAAGGRPRAAGAGDRGLPQPGHERDRARTARRAGAGAPGGRSEARRDPDRDHGLGSGLRSDRELRGHRQSERWRACGRPHGAAARQQGPRAAAPVPGRVGEHHVSREWLPAADEEHVSRASTSSRPINMPGPPATPPSGQPRTCSTASAATSRASSASTSPPRRARSWRCRTSAGPASSPSLVSTPASRSSKRCRTGSCRGSSCRTRSTWAISA